MDEPPQHPDQPRLTPQFCFNQTALRDFLRLSRTTLDDSISARLNGLLQPTPFNALGVSNPSSPRPPTGRRRNNVPPDSCSQFMHTMLLPSWSARSEVLTYCGLVAAEGQVVNTGRPSASRSTEDGQSPLNLTDVQSLTEQQVDERLDPYSARHLPPESEQEQLVRVVRNEREVERIIRERTWGIVRERCGEDVVAAAGRNAEEAMELWRREKERSGER